jgi:isoleucyl-tRNA synthetase
LGNLVDFDPERDRVSYEQMLELDRWALHRLQEVNERILRAYADFEFHPVYHTLHNFCVIDLSSFYLDIIKDRLYVSPPSSVARRSAQTAMNEILQVLVRLMAPILSFTADEVWQYMKKDIEKYSSVHADLFIPVKDEYKDQDLAERWEEIIKIRKVVTRTLETARKEKVIGHSLDASLKLGLSDELDKKLSPYKDDLRSIFIVSSVSFLPFDNLGEIVESDEVKGLRVAVENSGEPKCDRCWVHDRSVGEYSDHPTICKRCFDALAEMESGLR